MSKYTVSIDISEAPEMTQLQSDIQNMFNEFYPRLAEDLHTDGFEFPNHVSITVKKGLDYPGAADNDKIVFNGDWFTKNPEDMGCIIHEMTHIVQHYPTYDFWWIVEGIADYMRYEYGFQPERSKPKAGGKYDDGYATSANFLHFITDRHSKALIKALNTALRQGTCSEAIFEQITGKDVATLWEEYQASFSS